MKLKKPDNEFVELFEMFGQMFGLDTLTSKVMGILFLQPEEVAMEEIADATGYSLASISNKAQFLTQIGMLQKRNKPGTRKTFLYMEKDLFAHIDQKMHLRVDASKKMAEKLPGIINQYDKTKDKDKIQILENHLDTEIKLQVLLTDFLKKLDKMRSSK